MEDLQGEIWKPIIYKGVDYTGRYGVSNMGRVKRIKANKILSPSILRGYKCLTLYLNKKKESVAIHRLVANCFICEIKGKKVIDHINSNRLDNNLSNLRIVTHRENTSRERVIKSGLPCGVYNEKDKYKGSVYSSRIEFYGKLCFLGNYKTIDFASKSYQIALQAHEQGKSLSEVFKAVNEYRESINLKPIKRRNK